MEALVTQLAQSKPIATAPPFTGTVIVHEAVPPVPVFDAGLTKGVVGSVPVKEIKLKQARQAFVQLTVAVPVPNVGFGKLKK